MCHILWSKFDVELKNHGYYTIRLIRPYFILKKKIKINSRSGQKRQNQFDFDLSWPDLEPSFWKKNMSNGMITVIFEFFVENGP